MGQMQPTELDETMNESTNNFHPHIDPSVAPTSGVRYPWEGRVAPRAAPLVPVV